jgi:cytochrome c
MPANFATQIPAAQRASAALFALAALGLATMGLAACGKPSQAPGNAAATSATPAAPAPGALTDAQKKALLADLPPAYQSADLSNGEAKFALCRSCHTTDAGGSDMIGPNLAGVFGRKAGSKPGFSYSEGLAKAGWSWDAEHLDKWIENPHAVEADTKMTFVGLQDPNDRRDVIAFLKVQTSPPPKA